MKDLLIYRPYIDDDEGYVCDTWCRSIADECAVNHRDRNDTDARAFLRRLRKSVIQLIGPETVLVASPRKDPLTVNGWICFTKPATLHFIYVPRQFRDQKIARTLVATTGLAPKVRATHFTSWGFPRVAKLFEELTFNPLE